MLFENYSFFRQRCYYIVRGYREKNGKYILQKVWKITVLYFNEIIWLIKMKVKTIMKNRSHWYGINRRRPRDRLKYTKYKRFVSIMKFICTKKHLSDIWGSIHEKLKKHCGWVERNDQQNEIQSAYLGNQSFSIVTWCCYFKGAASEIKNKSAVVVTENSDHNRTTSMSCLKKVVDTVETECSKSFINFVLWSDARSILIQNYFSTISSNSVLE